MAYLISTYAQVRYCHELLPKYEVYFSPFTKRSWSNNSSFFSFCHSVVYGPFVGQQGNSSRHYVNKVSSICHQSQTSSSFHSWHRHLPSQPFGLSDRPELEIVNNYASYASFASWTRLPTSVISQNEFPNVNTAYDDKSFANAPLWISGGLYQV